MISVDKAVLARYSKGGMHFEVLVDPEKALDFKEGKVKIEEVLAVEEIFKDAAKGDRASKQGLEKAFKTADIKEAAKQIILMGEVQLTTEQKRKMQEERKKQIINLISRRSVDPKTGLPHPPTRIALALEQVRFHVDPFKPAGEQVDAVVRLLRPILPIRIENKKIAVKIQPQYAPKVYKVIHRHTVRKEEWQSDGSLIAIVEIPAGIQNEFFNELNKTTKGSVQTKIV